MALALRCVDGCDCGFDFGFGLVVPFCSVNDCLAGLIASQKRLMRKTERKREEIKLGNMVFMGARISFVTRRSASQFIIEVTCAVRISLTRRYYSHLDEEPSPMMLSRQLHDESRTALFCNNPLPLFHLRDSSQ